jgi:hypothetical protein
MWFAATLWLILLKGLPSPSPWLCCIGRTLQWKYESIIMFIEEALDRSGDKKIPSYTEYDMCRVSG